MVPGGCIQRANPAAKRLRRGVNEYRPERQFFLRANTPVAFHLLTSHVRLQDQAGDLIEIDPNEISGPSSQFKRFSVLVNHRTREKRASLYCLSLWEYV